MKVSTLIPNVLLSLTLLDLSNTAAAMPMNQHTHNKRQPQPGLTLLSKSSSSTPIFPRATEPQLEPEENSKLRKRYSGALDRGKQLEAGVVGLLKKGAKEVFINPKKFALPKDDDDGEYKGEEPEEDDDDWEPEKPDEDDEAKAELDGLLESLSIDV